MDELQRRPNPPGWVPPREGSAYNPFDPAEKRPPEGYPSEFKTPGRESSWSSIPKNASQYRQMKETMKRLEYTPRPLSDLYPGQYKQLRRVQNYTGFYRGVQLTSTLLCYSIVIYGVFFHRWNDGYENIFSELYRGQLRWRYWLTGSLTPEQMDDLKPKFRSTLKVGKHQIVTQNAESLESARHAEETGLALERPQKKHVIEAQRILQQDEERLLRALDIAEQEVASKREGRKGSWW